MKAENLTISDGGPAFPHDSGYDYHNERVVTSSQGMSLRDWFAGMALTGLCMAHDKDFELHSPHLEESYANASYRVADAMLKERKKL